MDEKELKLEEYKCKLEDARRGMEIYARAVVMYFIIVGACFKFIFEPKVHQLIIWALGSLVIIFNIFYLFTNYWCKKKLNKHLLYLNKLGDALGFQSYPSPSTGFNICIFIKYIIIFVILTLFIVQKYIGIKPGL